ncbi:MAG: transporter substrate-binding domain-containing protein [Motiliproteus sp.]
MFIRATPFILLSLSMPLFADEVHIAALDFGGLVTEEGNGVYQQLTREAADRTGITYKESFYPAKRAKLSLKRGIVDCTYGPVEQQYRSLGKENLVATSPIGQFKSYIFTLKGTPIIELSALKDQRVVGVRGFNELYAPAIRKGIHIEYLNSTSDTFKILQRGRVDAILGFLPDMNKHLDQLNYNANAPLMVAADRIFCLKSSKTIEFIDKINQGLDSMREDGSFREILGEHYIE